jgi:hypothetical protein
MSNLSRRSLVALAATMPALTAAPAVAGEDDPVWAALGRLFHEARELEAGVWRRYYAACEGATNKEIMRLERIRDQEITRITKPIMDRIIATPVNAIAGLKVKAWVAYACCVGQIDAYDREPTDIRAAFRHRL